MKRIFGFMGAALAALSLAIAPVAADQIIRDNLTVDGRITAMSGINPLSNDSGITNTVSGSNAFFGKISPSCGAVAMAGTDGTDTTPVATTFYYSQVNIPANTLVTGISVFNGTVASGNIKVGIADVAGRILATSASTAMSGTDTYQNVALTAPVTLKGPNSYFILLFVDNTTARFNTHTLAASCVTGTVTSQVYATGFTNFSTSGTFTTGVGPIASFY